MRSGTSMLIGATVGLFDNKVTEIRNPVPGYLKDDFLVYWQFLSFAIVRGGRRMIGPSFDRTKLDNLTLGLDRAAARNLYKVPRAIARLARSSRITARLSETYDAVLMPTWRERDGDYPLMLISPASNTRISSTLGFTGAPPRLLMHPRDAASRGLTHGGEVKVWNHRGEVILPLDITEAVTPGVVSSEKGAWLATSRTGQTISALVSSDMRADLAEGACFNDTLVDVVALA